MIEPNTVIRFYSGVPIDNTYHNTLYFASKSAQSSFFNTSGYLKQSFTNQSYQRVERGKIRVAVKADTLYDCNYVAFQNTAYGAKWFYAFILAVEYINDHCCEISFEIDVIQSYLFDITILDCWVEREHSITDNVGDNTVPESVELGELICDLITGTGKLESYSILMASTWSPTHTDHGDIYFGTVTGLNLWFETADTLGIQRLRNRMSMFESEGKLDTIVCMTMIPSNFVPVTPGSVDPKEYTISIDRPTSLGEYGEPRNKKLLTYPYCYLAVSTGNNVGTYRYEYFYETLTCDFKLRGTTSISCELSLVPYKYNGSISTGSGANEYNFTECMYLGDFPQIAWQGDSFKQFLALNGLSSLIGTLGSVAGLGISVATGNPIGAVGSGLALAQDFASLTKAAAMPNTAHGSQSQNIDVAGDQKDFYFKRMMVNPESAQIIDSYFDKFGYATNRLKTPNRSTRPHWNYVKTSGCTVKGKAPADDVRKFCEIHDRGITYWKSASEVGNYTLDNSPT